MIVVTGEQLLGLGKALASLESLNAGLKLSCAQQWICENGHEMSGAELLLDQIKCHCGGEFIFRRIPASSQPTT